MKYLSIALDVELLRLGILRDSLLCKAITCVVHKDKKYDTIPNALQQVQEVTEKADTSDDTSKGVKSRYTERIRPTGATFVLQRRLLQRRSNDGVVATFILLVQASW